MADLCAACIEEPQGEGGHRALEFRMDDPVLGHRVFDCRDCGERWIRRASLVQAFAWSRYSRQFAGRMGPATSR